jgi:hypothetical protein
VQVSLPYHRGQLSVQPVEVRLLAQFRGERSWHPRSIILPVEAAVYELLYSPAKGIDQGRDGPREDLLPAPLLEVA